MTATRPGPRTSRGPRAIGASLLRALRHSGAAMGQVSIEMLIQRRVPRKTEAKALISLEVIPDNWTQKFEPHGGQISKP